MSTSEGAAAPRAPLEFGWYDPNTLTPNPANWRKHPDEQVKALDGALTDVGWAGALLLNRRTGRLVDGHARLLLAKQRGEAVPVLIGDWTEQEERRILLGLDPIGQMAQKDSDAVANLLAQITGAGADWLKQVIGHRRRGGPPASPDALAGLITTEPEWQPAAETAEDIIEAVSRHVRRLAEQDPERLRHALAVVVPRRRGAEVLVLVDPNTADAITELRRYAEAGHPSPVEALMAALVPMREEHTDAGDRERGA